MANHPTRRKMEAALIHFSAEVEARFNNLPQEIADEYEEEYDVVIDKLNEAQNAVVALNGAFRKAGFNKL